MARMNIAFPIAAVVLLLPLGCGSGAAGPSGGSGGGAGSRGLGGAGGAATSAGAGGAGNSGGAGALEGFFIAADIDGRTRVSTHNIATNHPGAIFQWATAEASKDSSEWYFNIQLPVPLPPAHVATCATDNMYIDFRDREVAPERWFASRGSSACAVTFVATAQADTLEGTFTATLRLVGTSTNYAVTNGHFRLPFAP